nr:hypothetical protein [Tanacetum cinerariifolium]
MVGGCGVATRMAVAWWSSYSGGEMAAMEADMDERESLGSDICNVDDFHQMMLMDGGDRDDGREVWRGGVATVVVRWLRWRQPWMKGRWRCSGEMVVMPDLWWGRLW